MIQLKLGKMTSREIAEWMGISYNTYRNSISQRLEELTLFADFEKIYGGVIIKEIYVPIFIKGTRRNMDKTYLRLVMENDNPLDTIRGMARDLWYSNQAEGLSMSGLRYQLSKAGERTFGITGEKESQGICGSRHYVWAIKVDDRNNYRYLTEKEQELFNQLTGAYYHTTDGIKEQQEKKLYEDAWKEKEISDEEYLEFLKQEAENDGFYSSVITEFREQTGEMLVRATEHEVNILAAHRIMEEN